MTRPRFRPNSSVPGAFGAGLLVAALLAPARAFSQQAPPDDREWIARREMVDQYSAARVAYNQAAIAEAVVGVMVGVVAFWLSRRISKLEARLDDPSVGKTP